ncbi:MAG: hypothetical protein QM680_14195 [Luteolibacter sp.]
MPPKDTPETPAAPKDPIVLVRITEHKTIIGDFEHATGHVAEMPKSKADALVALGKAEIIGVP